MSYYSYNNKKMRYLLAALFLATLFTGCGKEKKTSQKKIFTDEVRLSVTPVKDQGRSSLCWAYAMLATIETEHIMRGDSVNLSVAYVARNFIREQVDKCYLSEGKKNITTRGMMPQLIRLIQTYGLMPYDSYHSDKNINTAARKVHAAVKKDAAIQRGLKAARDDAGRIMDSSINPMPYHIYMYSMEYTPIEFAHSVCLPDEYMAFTSFTHLPLNRKSVLSLPDNYNSERFMNIRLDDMMRMIEKSIRTGHPVCWEGDISEEGFSFEKGIADVTTQQQNATPQQRQREFETFRTTDDHCMAIVGLAHDKKGRKFFICKNSWGTGNPYGGMMYLSADYIRLKTIAVAVNRYALMPN